MQAPDIEIQLWLAEDLLAHLLQTVCAAVSLSPLCGERLTLRNCPGDILPVGAGGEQRTNQEIERDRGITGLHFRDARLAGMKALCQFAL